MTTRLSNTINRLANQRTRETMTDLVADYTQAQAAAWLADEIAAIQAEAGLMKIGS